MGLDAFEHRHVHDARAFAQGFCGGVFRWLDTLGSARYLDLAASYEHLGPLYTATDGLREKARQNATYYPEAAPARPSGSLKCA